MGGIGYAGAAAELIEFAERYQVPVVTSLWDKDSKLYPDFWGLIGIHGSFTANIATEADFMISY